MTALDAGENEFEVVQVVPVVLELEAGFNMEPKLEVFKYSMVYNKHKMLCVILFGMMV